MCTGEICTAAERDRYEKAVISSFLNMCLHCVYFVSFQSCLIFFWKCTLFYGSLFLCMFVSLRLGFYNVDVPVLSVYAWISNWWLGNALISFDLEFVIQLIYGLHNDVIALSELVNVIVKLELVFLMQFQGCHCGVFSKKVVARWTTKRSSIMMLWRNCNARHTFLGICHLTISIVHVLL